MRNPVRPDAVEHARRALDDWQIDVWLERDWRYAVYERGRKRWQGTQGFATSEEARRAAARTICGRLGLTRRGTRLLVPSARVSAYPRHLRIIEVPLLEVG